MSIFSNVPKPKLPSSSFNLSEEHKLSMNFGDLVPILCKEVLPGDRFKGSTELLIKFAPLKAPVMHRLKAKVDYFFVPNFQVSETFAKFINPKVNTAASPVVMPYITPKMISDSGKGGVASLADYLGLPVTQSGWMASTKHISPLPFLCYQHIYNSFFRDQNMEVLEGADPETSTLFLLENVLEASGADFASLHATQKANLFQLRKSAWKKDYFTSALPTPQAGDDVVIPIGGLAPVSTYEQTGDGEWEDDGNGIHFPEASDVDSPDAFVYSSMDTDGYLSARDASDPDSSYNLGVPDNLYADLSNQNMLSVNLFRQLIQLQGFKEIAERGGTRYPEITRNFFNAFLPDYWFGRPLYLGGQIQPINVGEVVQTSQTTSGDSGSAQGYRAGIAGSYGRTKTFRLKAPCHGFLMGLLRIMPEATYQQGVERMWTRESLFDYAWPQFANLGEQEIYNREIFAQGNDKDDEIFGYAPRYAEYKTGHCHVAGKFRTDLDYWHFGRVFASLPTLSKSFVMMDTMDYDPFAVTDASVEHVYVDLYNNLKGRRHLPYFARPATL